MNQKLFSLIVILLMISTQIHSQRDPMRYGRIDRSDLEMQYYEADSSANALILGDYGTIRITWNNTGGGFEYHFIRHLRMKVFNSAAFDEGNFKLLLYKGDFSDERSANIKATSYYLVDNKVEKTDLVRRDIFTEEVNASYNSVNFSVPDLREGCVFEVEYTIVSPFVRHLPKWQFQYEVPSRFSELRVFIPEWFRYGRQVRGFLDLSSHSTQDATQTINLGVVRRQDRGISASTEMARINYRENQEFFRMEDIPAFTREPYMDHPINYVAHVEYELNSVNFPHAPIKDYSTSWQQINNDLIMSPWFGDQLKRAGAISSEAKAIMENVEDPLSRMVAAYQLVQNEMFWNGMNTIYVTNSLRQSWNRKAGSSADVNLLLVLFLRELNLDADPVILSTRNFGKVFDWQTTLRKFNYVVAHVTIGDEVYLLDATEKNQPWNLLPERAINGKGRLISSSIPKAGWVDLENAPQTTINETTTIVLKNNGNFDAIVMRQMDNYAAYNLRKKAKSYTNNDDHIAAIEADRTGLRITDLTLNLTDDLAQPVSKRVRLAGIEQDDSEKEVIYLNPNIYSRISSNPFRLPERLFPVNFTYPRKETYTYRISIPPGYEFDELPESMAIAMEDRACFLSYRVLALGLQLQIIIDLEINKPIFAFDEYDYLREFFAQFVEKQAEMIVIRKQL